MATDATCVSPPAAPVVTTAGSVADLYELHIVAATRLAYLLTGSWVAAEDIAQDAFLRSASRLAALRNPDRFGGYLRRAVINEVAANHRARDRQAKREQRVHRSNEATRGDDLDDLGAELDFVGRLRALP